MPVFTSVRYREYDEGKWHLKFRMNLSQAIKYAEERLRDHSQSVIINHNSEIYTVYLDENDTIVTERLQ